MKVLRLISRQQDAFQAALAAQIKSFEQLNEGIKIECEFLPIHDHYERMVEGNGCLTGDYDLFLCCTDWLPSAIHSRKLLCLDDFVRVNPPADWPEGWHLEMRKLINYEGNQYGMPWHDGPEVLHYRSDLFENPAEKAEFLSRIGRQLEVPKTWKEFLEVAQFFTRPCEGLWGCCEAAYTDGHNNVYDFLIQLWSRGGELFNDKSEPAFASTVGVEALQFYVDLFHKHKVAPMECLQLGSVECGDYYAQGHAAMSWNWIGFAATCELPPSRIIGKNRCTQIPAGDGPRGESVSLNIYWALTIPVGAKHPEEAYRFIHYVASPEQDKVTSLCGANGVRLSTWRDPEILAKFPYYGVIEKVHEKTRTLPATPSYPAINEILSHAVHQAVNLELPVQEALQRAEQAVKNL